MCACAVVSGARSLDELAEWGTRASHVLLEAIGVRRHLLGWRRAPSQATIGRVLGAVEGTPPSASTPGPRRVIAVDGKALKGSARLDASRRHLLSAVRPKSA
ncbi:hypothetical protein ACH4TV_31040 [Streptomyces sp. NPDC020898]|uniref:hypothetical protein n=1 Tax=Streptomyces sp. NPDC020898 TaxID=3365101 RepID=UPI00379168F7